MPDVVDLPPVSSARRDAAASRVSAEAPGWHLLRELLRDPRLTAPPEPILPPIGYAGRVTILAGREKSGGKSTTAGAAVAHGSRRGVLSLVLTLDEPLGDTVQRLHRLDANGELVCLMGTRPESFDDLILAIEETGAQALVIDSLEQWVAGRVTESGDSFQWAAALAPLQQLARKRNIAVILLHHSKKSDGQYRDSTAIGAAADIIITLKERGGGDRRAEVQGRFPVPNFSVRMDDDGQVSFDADDSPGTADRGPAPVALQSNVLRLLQSAEPEGLTSGQWFGLAKEKGIARTSFFRARKSLHDQGYAAYGSKLYRVSPSGARWINGEGES